MGAEDKHILKSEPPEKVEQRDADGDAGGAAAKFSQHAMQIQMSEKDLNTRDKVQLGNWLQRNFEKLDNAEYRDAKIEGDGDPHVPNGSVSIGDLMRTYSDGKWKDGTPMQQHDKLLCRQAIEHFNQVAPGGTFSLAIDRYDVDRLQHGVRAQLKSDGTVVAKYQDGHTVTSKDDKVQVKRPDGTVDYATQDVHMVLHPNGRGVLNVTSFQDMALGKREQPVMPLQRQRDGSWQGKDPDGNTYDFAFGKGTTSTKVNGEVVFKADKDGVMMKGDQREVITGDQHGVVFGGTDEGRMSWQRGGMGQVQAVRTANGDVNTEYGGGVAGVIAHPDGSRTVYWENSEEKGPIVEISKDNELRVRDAKGEVQTLLIDQDGTQSAGADDYAVTLDKDGRVKVSYTLVSEEKDESTGTVKKTSEDRAFTLSADGRYRGPNSRGEETELDRVVPPPLK